MSKKSAPTAGDKLQSLRKELNQCFLERSLFIDGLLATMLLGGNAVLFGPPGCAKSAMLSAICGAIDGANFFNRLLQKAQPPEELLGQPSLKALQTLDVLKRNTKGRLPEAHIAFLDEIFRCNPTTLNALLRIINEKIFENPDPASIPLIFLVGAANQVPTDEELAAFVDRFVYRPWVGYVRRRSSRKELIKRAATGIQPCVTVELTLDEVYKLQGEAKAVQVSEALTETLLDVQMGLEKSGFIIGDRKLQALVNLLQCLAYVQGDSEIYVDHIHEIFPDCLWLKNQEERKVIKKILNDIIPSVNQQALSWYDAAKAEISTVSQAALNYQSQPFDVQEKALLNAVEKASKNLVNIQEKVKEAIANSTCKDTRTALKVLADIDQLLLEVAGYRNRVYA